MLLSQSFLFQCTDIIALGTTDGLSGKASDLEKIYSIPFHRQLANSAKTQHLSQNSCVQCVY